MAAAISEPIKRCCELLRGSKTDAEKFAALFMVTKLVKAKDCTTAGKTALFEAIGFPYLKKLLNNSAVPADCPPSIYKSVALSILTCFCATEELATHPEMLANIPVFVDIIRAADDASDDDDGLIIVSEAYSCLQSIAAFEAGLQALLAADIVTQMSQIYTQQSFQTDEALNLLVALAVRFGPQAWSATDAKPFHALVQHIALDMETDHTERKFELCTILTALIYSCRHEVVVPTLPEEIWPQCCYKGLSDILRSKIGKNQREPALRLCGTMMELCGVEWALSDREQEPKTFFLLLLQLAAIEVRMQLDDRSFKQALTQQALVTACFIVLEVSINYLHTDQLDLEQKEKQQVYSGLKGAFGGIVSVLTKLDKDKKSAAALAPGDRLFALAMVRCMCAWLAQETTALRPAIYPLLPYVFELVNQSFREAKAHKTEQLAGERPTDVLRIMMPALCHLAVEDRAREAIFKQGQEAVLFEALEFYFSLAQYKRPPIPRAERLARMNEPDPVPTERQLEEQKDARAACVSLCNVFMNLTVLEPRKVEQSELFDRLRQLICDSLPLLKEVPENLVLHGHLAILGLLLIKQQAKKIKKNDFTLCRYIQATIRWLWDAYIVDDSNDPTELVIGMTYKENWSEMAELWFLGMQTMSGVLAPIPWISEFALESGWAEGIVETLKKVKIGTLPSNVKSAFEDFLCSLVGANREVAGVLKKADALRVCRNHRLMELGKTLFGD